MSLLAERSVTLLWPEDDERFGREKLSLSDFESDQGYILLGEPGMGKTTSFIKESKRILSDPPMSARRFIHKNPEYHPIPKTAPLFIDGIDEVRVDGGKSSNAIDHIINILKNYGTPRFRLSCRSGGWFKKKDFHALSSSQGLNTIPILQLNPLDDKDVLNFVSQQVHDAEVFIRKAYDHGLKAFLYNPLLLSLLLRSVQFQGWSRSITEIFEKACQQLVCSSNIDDHDGHIPNFEDPSQSVSLDVIGLLSSLLLIGNKDGWTIQDTGSPDILLLNQVSSLNHHTLLAALRSSAFTGDLNQRVPFHRLLSEFLSARFLSHRIQNGASLRRVSSLLVGPTGRILPDLRGVAAWLAAFHSDVRSTLIKIDPLSIAFNGDSTNFSPEQKQEWLLNLEKQIHNEDTSSYVTSLGALAQIQSISKIWNIASSSDRSESRQDLVHYLLKGVRHSFRTTHLFKRFSSEPELKIEQEYLQKILYDHNWDTRIRYEALLALNKLLIGSPDHGSLMRNLLSDLTEHRLSDKTHVLLGSLLELTYPNILQPEIVWDCLVDEPLLDSSNPYWNFYSNLCEKSNRKELEILLKTLTDSPTKIIPRLANKNFSDLVLKLLAQCLELFGDQKSIIELANWFTLVKIDDFSSQLIPIHCSDQLDRGMNKYMNTAIRGWLNERKMIQYQLIEHDLIINEDHIGDINLERRVGIKYLGLNVSREFRSWCLNRAIKLSKMKPRVAEELARWSTIESREWKSPLPDEEVTNRVVDTPHLREWNQTRMTRKAEHALGDPKREEDGWLLSFPNFENQRQHELTYLLLHQDELSQGQCPPELLDKLAGIYFQGNREEHNPNTGLEFYLNHEQTLVDATLKGFQSVLNRDDLPDLDKIAEIHEKGQRSHFALPILAAMEENGKSTLCPLSEKGKRRVLGIYMVTNLLQPQDITFFSGMSEYVPQWYEHALSHYPMAVADALVSVHRACVQSKTNPTKQLVKMAYDETYAKVAPLAMRKKIMTIFPTKCSGKQLASLHAVLLTVIRVYNLSSDESEKEDLRKLILHRLRRKNMDVAQEAKLLCAGVCIARDLCLPRFTEFLSTGRMPRIVHVFDFFESNPFQAIGLNLEEWSSKELSQFIRAIGRHLHAPIVDSGAYSTDHEDMILDKHLDLMSLFISELSDRSNRDASQALVSLVCDSSLSAWKRRIEDAQRNQAWRSSAAERKDLTTSQIHRTLYNGPPSYAGDLHGLAVDVLEDLRAQTRNNSSNDWRKYWKWNHSSLYLPIRPEHEDQCRDRLLSNLEPRFEKYNIDVQPEGRFATDGRSDLRVSHPPDTSILIEIKQNLHLDIWRAINKRLLPIYLHDSKINQYGIYLVLWLGPEYMNIVSPCGQIPDTHQELADLLEKQIDPTLKNLVSIFVIDVSPMDRDRETVRL